jgi:hypothetical protein
VPYHLSPPVPDYTHHCCRYLRIEAAHPRNRPGIRLQSMHRSLICVEVWCLFVGMVILVSYSNLCTAGVHLRSKCRVINTVTSA